MNMNPLAGLLKTVVLLIARRVIFLKQDRDRQIVMEDGLRFRVFRHVKIRPKHSTEPKAVFIVRFRPRGMTVQQNIHFSLLPMMVFMEFPGFCEKYWCVNDETGLCQGIYAWQTVDDARNYSQSIAMRFMTKRSYAGSVHCQVLDQEQERYWLFAENNTERQQSIGKHPSDLLSSRHH